MHRKKKRYKRDLTFPPKEEVDLFELRDKTTYRYPDCDFDYFEPLKVEKPE